MVSPLRRNDGSVCVCVRVCCVCWYWVPVLPSILSMLSNRATKGKTRIHTIVALALSLSRHLKLQCMHCVCVYEHTHTLTHSHMSSQSVRAPRLSLSHSLRRARGHAYPIVLCMGECSRSHHFSYTFVYTRAYTNTTSFSRIEWAKSKKKKKI